MQLQYAAVYPISGIIAIIIIIITPVTPRRDAELHCLVPVAASKSYRSTRTQSLLPRFAHSLALSPPPQALPSHPYPCSFPIKRTKKKNFKHRYRPLSLLDLVWVPYPRPHSASLLGHSYIHFPAGLACSGVWLASHPGEKALTCFSPPPLPFFLSIPQLPVAAP